MDLLVLDFESYFDADYSLKKMTTEEYIRDPRFQAHMLGYWEPATMPAPTTCTPEMLRSNDSLRAKIFNAGVLVHHAQFDGLILSHHFGLKPAFWFDTLAMARLVLPKLKSHSLEALAKYFNLPEKNVPYNLFRGVKQLSPELYAQVAEGCEHDVALTAEIWKRLLPFVPKEELRCVDITIRMFTEPVLRLDRSRMQRFLNSERLRKAKAMLQAGSAIGVPMPTSAEQVQPTLDAIEVQLQSSDKFRVALESLGYQCPMKWSAKQKCDIPALAKNDDGMQELLDHEDNRIAALAAARLGVKSTLNETRAERLLSIDQRGAIPLYLTSYATKTLRVGGGDSNNVLNWPRGGEIRKSILAPEGHQLVIVDESQIEYRVLLWLTGQWDKLDALVAGRDLYCEFASEFYMELVTREDKPRRGVGKQGILMGGYGAGKKTMIRTAAGGGYGPPVYLTDAEGQRMVDIYRAGHPKICSKGGFWNWCDGALRVLASGGDLDWRGVIQIADHRIWLPNDTAIDYTGLRWAANTDLFPDQEDDGQGPSWWETSRKGWTRTWGSHLTADIVQGLARVLIARAKALVGQRYKLVLEAYDELVAVVPTPQAEEAMRYMITILETPPAWCPDISLQAEGIISERYDK